MSIIRWAELRQEEFEEVIKKTDGLCIVPVGCYEMHGEHLPVATDVYEAVAVAEKTSELEPVCVFPPFDMGDVSGLVTWKGSIRLEPKLMFDLLENYCTEIRRNGFDKIVLLNHHGGNYHFLHQFERNITYKKRDYSVMICAPTDLPDVKFSTILQNIKEHGSGYYPELTPEDEETIRIHVEEKHQDGHGGLKETSEMLAIRPDLVHLDRMSVVSGLTTHKGDVFYEAGFTNQTIWGLNQPNSYCGHDPVGASDRIGRLIIRLSAEGMANACRVFKKEYDILKEEREYSNKFYNE